MDIISPQGYDQPMQGMKNYYTPTQDSSGFKFRVEGREVINEMIDALRGGVKKGKYGKTEYDEQFRLMNDLGISRASAYLRGVVNKNTHLSRFPDKDSIMKQMISLSEEWAMSVAINRKHWQIKDPDLVQQIVETAMISALLRADEGFEAEISGKSHQVNENLTTPMPQQNGFLQRLNPFRRW